MKQKIILGLVSSTVMLSLSVSSVFAHAVVKPNQAGIGAFQDFTIGVPSEKESSTVSVRLVLPEGLEFVTPFTKNGWQIQTKKEAITQPQQMENDNDHDEEAPTTKVTEITWTGGSIPAGQKDQFMFSAKVPPQPTTLSWKIYQTYADGSVVAWDQDPKASPSSDHHDAGPFSTTVVVDDLTKPQTTPASTTKDSMTTVISYLGFIFGAVALSMVLRNRR